MGDPNTYRITSNQGFYDDQEAGPDRGWGQMDDTFDNGQVTQPAQFFQFFGGPPQDESATSGYLFPGAPMTAMQPLINQGNQYSGGDVYSTPQTPWSDPINDYQAQPSKRRRLNPPNFSNSIIQTAISRAQQLGPNSGPPSECCSSCSEGIPCAAPHCGPCSEPDCDGEVTEEVVPCTKSSCAQLACTDQCLGTGIQSQESWLDQSPSESERNMLKWVEATLAPLMPGNIAQQPPAIYQSTATDPRLQSLNGPEDASVFASPAPIFPSVANNVPTPYFPNGGLISTQSTMFPQQEQYTNHSNDILSRAGTRFNPTIGQWSDQTYNDGSNGNSAFMYCNWDGCHQSIPTQEEWLPHLHQQHVDPQMTFGCPLQSETCPPVMNLNPLDHLQQYHGFNFDTNGSGISCPAPTCLPGETFCNPAMLHNHFDSAHATLAQGSVQCRLDACQTYFQEPDQFLSHLNEHHPLRPSVTADEERHLPSPEVVKTPHSPKHETQDVSEETSEISDEDPIFSCKWKIKGVVCGFTGLSGIDLQSHIKTTHLETLDKTTEYRCQWEGCLREPKMGREKSKFSQRGKLERHLATHTNFKCSECDICGKTFSAPQAMKQHRLLHTGEKPWKCKHCDKRFPQQSACTVHERTHTNEKPLECGVCGKRFSESSNLAKHRKIHGERGMHRCTYRVCNKTFHRLDQLKRHESTHRGRKTSGGVWLYEGSSVKADTEVVNAEEDEDDDA